MTDVLHVTPAQVLAAKLAVELSDEAGEVPDEALNAIASAQVLTEERPDVTTRRPWAGGSTDNAEEGFPRDKSARRVAETELAKLLDSHAAAGTASLMSHAITAMQHLELTRQQILAEQPDNKVLAGRLDAIFRSAADAIQATVTEAASRGRSVEEKSTGA